jgi:glutamate 5-kinase
MEDRTRLKDKSKIVIKIGTSSLTMADGKINFQRIEKLSKVMSELMLQGRKTMLVSSGAIAVGAGKIGLMQKPTKLSEKQALASIGQAELIKIYDQAFSNYNQITAQVLLTKDGVLNPIRRFNAKNTLNTLMNMHIIPIINENDTVSTDEIEFGDNDTLSAHVASMVEADLLIILSDIDGLYNGDPRKDENVQIISKVFDIADVKDYAGSSNSEFAKGGMVTKIAAANLCNKAGIDMVIANGEDPSIIFDIIEGKDVGTFFIGKTEHDLYDSKVHLQNFREKLG